MVGYNINTAQLNHTVRVAPNYIALIKTMRYGVGGKLTYQTGAKLRLGFLAMSAATK